MRMQMNHAHSLYDAAAWPLQVGLMREAEVLISVLGTHALPIHTHPIYLCTCSSMHTYTPYSTALRLVMPQDRVQCTHVRTYAHAPTRARSHPWTRACMRSRVHTPHPPVRPRKVRFAGQSTVHAVFMRDWTVLLCLAPLDNEVRTKFHL